MTKKALLIGINYVNDPNARLQGCIEDITNISDLFTKNYDYKKENVIQLRDDSSDITQQPTRNNILKEMNKIIEQTANLTEIWIHYSGHGSQLRDKDRDEMDGLDEVVVPVDYTTAGFITDDEIFNIVKNTKCKTMLLFDSCHSATICDLQWSFEYNYKGGFIKTQNNNKKINNPLVFSISGCKDFQTSADSYNVSKKKYVGAFTNSFITCLEKNNYNVNIIKLYADVCNYLQSTGFNQKSILSCSSMMPTFIFIKSVLPILSSNNKIGNSSATSTSSPNTFPVPSLSSNGANQNTFFVFPFKNVRSSPVADEETSVDSPYSNFVFPLQRSRNVSRRPKYGTFFYFVL
jgi:hypothetical protein